MQFRSLADLNRTVVANLHLIPDDIDLVVGVPRSGMLPATLIALALNVQLTDMDGFLQGRAMGAGGTRRREALTRGFESLRHALVVDDSILTGASMVEARERLSGAAGGKRLTFCAVYGASVEPEPADVVLEVVKPPRIFEWNVMHHSILEWACVDIDGVLCHDPTHEQNDDGEAYLRFLQHAHPLQKPTKRIGVLVTSRLEKYRPQTEAWLRERGIEYRELVMLDLPDAETRRRQGAHGAFKGEYYKSSPERLFIESELGQARKIAEISGKPVLCMDGPVMCYPGAWNPRGVYERARQSERLRRLARRLLGETRYAGLIARLKASGR